MIHFNGFRYFSAIGEIWKNYSDKKAKKVDERKKQRKALSSALYLNSDYRLEISTLEITGDDVSLIRIDLPQF